MSQARNWVPFEHGHSRRNFGIAMCFGVDLARTNPARTRRSWRLDPIARRAASIDHHLRQLNPRSVGPSLPHRSSAAYTHLVSRFWLTYCDLSGRVCGVLILDSWSLLQARFRACIEGLDCGTQYCEGHELEGDSAALVPPSVIGRMLSHEEAGKLIRKIERWIPKRSAADSVARRGTVSEARWRWSRG